MSSGPFEYSKDEIIDGLIEIKRNIGDVCRAIVAQNLRQANILDSQWINLCVIINRLRPGENPIDEEKGAELQHK